LLFNTEAAIFNKHLSVGAYRLFR